MGAAKRTLITGATGFVGGHLVECLLAAGDTVHGLARSGAWPASLSHLAARVPLHGVDLLDADRLGRVLAEFGPDRIVHLAGYADAAGSFRDPDAAWTGNLSATRNLYDVIARLGLGPRILFVSTGHVYGPSPSNGRPLDESADLRPVSPYGVSKAAADLLSYQITRQPGLDIIRVRPFNQIGPRQPSQYAAGHFARELARIEAGLTPPVLGVGDLSSHRDLTDVRDMVDAYRLLLEQGTTGEVYNAGSGVAVRIADMLDLLRSESRTAVEVVPLAGRMRPADAGWIVADSTKLHQATGWTPRFDLRQTLHDMLECERRALVDNRRSVAN